MNSSIRPALTILAAVAVASSISSCSKKEENHAVEAVEELPKVETSVVTARDVPQINEYTATVEADNINNIAPATPNRIKTIEVEVGDHVRKGQTLVTLDRSNSDQLKINLDQIEREYNRAVQLLEIGAGTQQAVDQLKAQLDAARSQYSNIIENTVLISPINGVVTGRNYDPGDMTGNLPVLTVGQLSPVVKVMINVTESDLSKIRVGMPVTVSFDAFDDEIFEGRVSRIHPTVDTATRTFRTEILISNPAERIIPGMFARVSVNLGERNNVVVPDRAIVKQTGSGNRYVYVLHDGKVYYERVELGRRLGDAYELLSGVNSGDTVIISGQTRLADGVEVDVISAR
ncbi:MAG: efflux RND transporter periplasmic adaptor subunit [Muribaculaceae bacterium]|nr:efflux RND transporter periplasmic adaptor subunit [Muribaculaceae bacterium]